MVPPKFRNVGASPSSSMSMTLEPCCRAPKTERSSSAHGAAAPETVMVRLAGHTLAAAFQDGTVLLWDVDSASWLKRACAVAARRLTQQEWQEFLPGRPYQPSCGAP